MTTDPKSLSIVLQNIMNEFQKSAELVDEAIGPIVTGTEVAPLMVHLMNYATLDHIKDVCEALTKMANKHMPLIAERAERLMTNEMLDSVDCMGKTWSVDTKSYAQVPAAMKHACVHWLKNHPLGKSLVEENYHPASLQKFVQEHIIDKGEVPPPFVSVFNKRILKARKIRGS